MPDLNRSLLSEAENADTLGGLTDVTITAPEEFQSLNYNGTTWVNGYSPVVSYVQNAEANTLTTGTVVYLFGGTGDHASVKRADNDSDATSSKTVGLVAANIAASQNGPVVTRGYVDGIDLSTGYTEGDVLWLGEDGGFTKTKPTAPEHLVFIGVVVRATNNGIIYVAAQNGYELDELHDVSISGLASGQFLKYNGSLWINDAIDLGTDTTGNYIATIAGTANEITVTGSGSETAAVTIGLPANVVIANNLTVTGDLTVSGNTTTLNTANLNVEDNFILLNSGETSTPTLNAGVEVKRGTSTNVQIRWNESTDKWQFTNDGSTYTDLGAGGATISETAPGSPVAGQVWFESDTAQTFVYYDSQWIEIGALGTAAIISDTAPSNPVSGQIWFNSSTGGTYVYYKDGSSNQWIEVGAQPPVINIGDTAPSTPVVGQIWFDSTAAATNIYYDSQWVEIGGGGSIAVISDTAPATPAVGQIWFNSTSGATYVYYDSAWVEIGQAPFDVLLNTIDAKGDLLVGTADNTIAKLASSGINNQVLTVDTSTATGLKWSAGVTTGKAIAMSIVFGG